MSELIFGSADRKENYKISKMLMDKRIRKISPRIYTTNMEEDPSAIIKRNILETIRQGNSPKILINVFGFFSDMSMQSRFHDSDSVISLLDNKYIKNPGQRPGFFISGYLCHY